MKRPRALLLESLEPRTPLAVDVSLVGTVLTVSFDDATDDLLELSIGANDYSTTGATVASAVGTVTRLVVTDAGLAKRSSFTLRQADQVLTGGLTVDANVTTATIADSVDTSGGAIVVDAARLTVAGREIDSGGGNQVYGGTLQLRRAAVFEGGGAVSVPDSAGKIGGAWAVRGGGASSETMTSVARFDDGSSIVKGSFIGSASFGAFTLTSLKDEWGYYTEDVFIAKIDADGNVLWAKRAGGTAEGDIGMAVTPLADGSAIVTDSFMQAATFGSTLVTSAGATDAFIAKLDGAGTFAWATGAGGLSLDAGARVATFTDGSAVVAGRFAGIAYFGSTPLESGGSEDVFVATLDANGQYLWVRRAGGTNGDSVSGLAALGDGSAILSGAFWVTAAFGGTSLTSAGANSWQNTDVLVARIDAVGEFRWAVRAGGIGADTTKSLSHLADGGVRMTGFFSDDPTVDIAEVPGGPVIVQFTAGGELATIPPIPRSLPAVSITASGTIALEGALVDLAGITVAMTKSPAGNTTHSAGIKVANIVTTSSGQPVNGYMLSGADAASFTIDGASLSLKSGVRLDFETKRAYSVTVSASDVPPTGGTFVTTAFTLAVTDVTQPPTIQQVVSPDARGYRAKEKLVWQIVCSQPVVVTGVPTLPCRIGSRVVSAAYVSGTGSDRLTFEYTVSTKDTASSLVLGNAVAFPKRSAIVEEARLLPAIPGAGATVPGVSIDTTPPRPAARIGVPAGRTYAAGEQLNFTVRFSENVFAGSVPQLSLQIAPGSGGERRADYVGGPGTSELTFRYIVQVGDATPRNKGISVGRTIVGGTIVDAVGNVAVRMFTVPSTAKIMINAVSPAASAAAELPSGRNRKAVRMLLLAEYGRN